MQLCSKRQLVPTSDLLKKALIGKYALGAYNVNNMEQILGLFEGCQRARSPFILQISKGARKYAGTGMMDAMIRAAEARYPDLVFATHLDHGDEKTCMDAIAAGTYSSVMIDASHEPFAENVAATRRVVTAAHAKGVSVEAELGKLGGVEEHIKVDEKDASLTDPDEAEAFVRESGCDSLAVAVGTSHGAYKFSGTQGLHLNRIAEIQKRLPRYPFVLHGASSVPADEVARINAAGGALKEGAKGVNLEDVGRAIPLGVTKINIDTDGRLVWTRVHREFFRDKPEGFDLRKPGDIFVEQFAKMVEERSKVLLSAGQLDAVRAALA
jgi:fructose-bisphosphate aldolase, class II